MKRVAVIALSMWIGAALLVVASVAPSAFAVLPTRTMAGALVGRVLPVVFVSGMVVSLPAIYVYAAAKTPRFVPAAVMFVSCFAAQFQVGPRIAKLRAEIGSAVDSLPVDDPNRILFGKLHATSVAYLGAAMLAAAIVLVMLLLAERRRTSELANG